VVQGLSSIVEAVPLLGKRAAIDMDSPLVRGASWLYYQVSRLSSKLYPDYWGYFHVGQVLQVDPAAAKDTVKDVDAASKHNLEVSWAGDRWQGMPVFSGQGAAWL
jgi:hypothetical protein